MKSIWQDSIRVINNKKYMLALSIVALCSYGFAITQPIIGIDDSAIGRYFEEGLGPTMGRYGFYLLNKILPVAEYTPFIVDFLGVLLLIVGAASWCVVWERFLGYKLSVNASIVFSSVMISAPIISEDFIYYLHNGIGICYVLSAYMMIILLDAIQLESKDKWKKYATALLILWICNSFYESFTVVLLMALAMGAVLKIVVAKQVVSLVSLIKQYIAAGVLLVISIVIRSIAIESVILIFSLQDQLGIMNKRSVLEALDWFKSSNGLAELVMTIKKYIAMYYVNAIAYIPIRIYVLAVAMMFIVSCFMLIKHKKILPLLLTAMMQFIPLILLFIEGHATFYRNSQYLPIYVAFVVLLVTLLVEKQKKFVTVWYVIVGILVYNQAYEMTQWYYIDYMKYEDAKSTVAFVSYELERSYDIEKPVVFVGNYSLPEQIVSKMYFSTDSKQYEMIDSILSLLDPNLTSCFMMPYGYSLSTEAMYSVFTWGNIAFEGWDKETHEYFAIHGHEFLRIMDVDQVQEIQAAYLDLPAFPAEGSIVETDEYIVVKFG
ncbi:MAG: glucosyltransferase domain-containing protein [Lachnospiraceae bacterium]